MSCFKMHHSPRFRWKSKRMIILIVAILYLFMVVSILKRTNNKSVLPDESTTSKKVTERNLRKTLENPPLSQNGKEDVIAVLVLVCDRVTVKRTLSQLMTLRPSPSRFPIIVSQDCGMLGRRVKSLVRDMYGKKVTYLMHPNWGAVKSKVFKEGVPAHMQGYYHIATHYGWALNYAFDKLGYENVIVVEDDLDISVDFFEYFEATLPILKSDPTLWCVSAYNDNGKPSVIDQARPDLLYRTDFFPGLGWMLTKKLWGELSPKWPDRFWDDWMREPKQRKDRACIHPEVSRTKTYGRSGVSNGQFFDGFLDKIVVNEKFVPFKTKNLDYLQKRKYDEVYLEQVSSAIPILSLNELRNLNDNLGSVLSKSTVAFRLPYKDGIEFAKLAREIGIMDDLKNGVPRNGYMGIVSVMLNGRRLYLVPTTERWKSVIG